MKNLISKAVKLLLCASIGVAVSAHTAPLHDPTLPLEQRGRPAVAQALQLHSILIGKHRKLAVINGQALREGDRIEDNLLVAIHAEFVALETNGRHWQLHLHKAGAKGVAGIRK